MLGTLLQSRYRIDAELGQGGMGVVYRAHDTLLNRPVAVKVLSAVGLGTTGKARLLTEAQAAAKLNHPNIVGVYDVGGASEADKAPFIVMELVDGQTLRNYQPASLAEVLALARQICAALDHAHSSGIIHRDLKPENIALTKSQTVKLMDFGLARSADAPRLTEEGALVGTFSYLAPELITGGEPSAQSDLYALGVMLYELVAGRPPFSGGDLMTVFAQHLHAPVVPPSTHNAEISPALDELILRLLSKQPEDRPASAAEVMSALERPASTKAETAPAVAVSLLDRIARGRLVAREREFGEANTLWQKAVSGEGGVLLVSGEPGIGKTRLVRELTARAEVTRATALAGECYAEGGAPYAPIAAIIQAAVDLPGFENLAGLPPLVLADLITLAPAMRAHFPDVPPNPPLDPQAEQQRLFEGVVALCTALSAQAPLLLVVDDAHWADSGTLSLLRYLARRTRKLRMLTVLTYREIELAEARALNEVLADLNRERLAVRIKLSRLNRDQTRDLLAAMFQEDITPDFLDGIYRETEGNPFFVEEVCKALIEDGKLYREGGRWQRASMDQIQVPQSVRVAVETRVSKLPEATQEILRLAAILGREFDFETLRTASDRQDEDALITALEDAERVQLITEVPRRGRSAVESFAFVHALIPSTLREGLSGLRRHRLHRKVAAAIEALRPDDYEALAYHAAQAGDEARALKFYTQAADRAKKLYANQDAIRFYTEALALVPDDPENYSQRFDLLASRATVYDLIGLREQQRADVDAMLALAEKHDDDARRFDSLLALADFYLETEFLRSREPAERAAAIARALADPVREARALRRLGWAAWNRFDLPQSRSLLELAAVRFREAGLPGEAATCLHMLSLTFGRLGDRSASQKTAEEAVTLSRVAGDKRQEAISLRRLAIAYLDQFRYAEAQPFTEAALALHRELGDRAEESNALNVLGMILAWLGKLDASEQHLRQSLDIAEAIGSSLGISNASSNLVEHFYSSGEYAGALAFLEAQLAKPGLARDEALLGFLSWRKAGVLADLGQHAPALEAAQAGLPLVEKHMGRGVQLNVVSFIGLRQAELSDWAQARPNLETALEQAEKTGVPPDLIGPLFRLVYAAWLSGEEADLRAGLIHLKRLVALLIEIDDKVGLAYSYDYAARLYLALNETDEALNRTTEALQLVKAFPYPAYMMEQFFFTHSRALRAAGREAEADDYLRRAYERVMLVAHKTKDDTLRRSWLENVKENREIVYARHNPAKPLSH